MLGAFQETAVVYDCMDELEKFRFSPLELVPRERYLLARADVVFADSRVLADAKRRYNEHVHDFGCGVDVEHFAAAMAEDTEVPEALRGQAGPILGYIGVVDERLDYTLIAHLAEQIPEATIVLVGPVVKVDPHDLPRRANIRYLGQQPYDLRPAFLKGVDVCVMPFALSKATAPVNRNKTLEFLASGKPVVSTAITDMVRTFSEEVMIAEAAHEFVEAVRRAARIPDIERRQRGLARAQGASWEAIAADMSRLMDEAVHRRELHDQQKRRSATANEVIGTPALSTPAVGTSVIGRPHIEYDTRRAP
jgi:glycosyltransferase involved in cell wall biosynthesis